jgi:hypothetical protein
MKLKILLRACAALQLYERSFNLFGIHRARKRAMRWLFKILRAWLSLTCCLNLCHCGPLLSALSGRDEAAQVAAAVQPAAVAQCADAQGTRSLRWPHPGDLRISEVLADPLGADAQREWLELWVAAPAPVDLAGLLLVAQMPATPRAARPRRRSWSFSPAACQTVLPGAYVVVGIAPAGKDWRGEAPVAQLVRGSQALPNTALALQLYAGAALVESVDLPAAVSGCSWSRNLQTNLWYPAGPKLPFALSPGEPHPGEPEVTP